MNQTCGTEKDCNRANLGACYGCPLDPLAGLEAPPAPKFDTARCDSTPGMDEIHPGDLIVWYDMEGSKVGDNICTNIFNPATQEDDHYLRLKLVAPYPEGFYHCEEEPGFLALVTAIEPM